ncbi:glycine cleavage system aminomethyltransferase GcvT [Actinomycetospora sp. CA-084318]|uniref:glycine cleavage system aminomethyltransferase GcvT n=1 Tax=Actinomycetospora sp. CA-084318 TaxID=3239892 RepID=UPI003D992949
MTEQRQDLRRSPLHARHEALGATFAPFGGWEMPVQYSGTVAEHTATREAVGLFDVSHLGKVRISGPGAAAFVDRCLTNDLGRIVPGKAQYTLCCADDGGVVDDLILYLVGDDEVFAVPNAANSAGVGRQLADAAPAGITVTDEHDAHVVLAVQGPRSRAVLAGTGVLPETGDVDLDYMAFVDSTWEGREVRVCRTGYTGEHGYELIAPAEVAETLWDALAAVVAEQGGLPAGLGARDTLRTEAGLPLHGQDLGPEITPVQARVGFAVGWKKEEFWGREALLAERERGPRRRAWGLKASGRGVPRAHMTVTLGGSPVGETTSGTFSPTLRTGIALALLDTAAGLSEGDVVSIDVRGRALECEVVAPPFVASHVR